MKGHLFGDRYEAGDVLGLGGMSEVYRGRDLKMDRDVAIKVLRADLARDPAFHTRFRREAQNAASLNHPAIVAVYDTGESESESGTHPYIVMEFVEGETLRDLLRRHGPFSPQDSMEIVANVCAALDFSHRHGIVHRDVKPANVMLTDGGSVKVMDFGIARAMADAQATMTSAAAVMGTAHYLAPEQARGEAVDARSDVYAAGCVLYELLVGAPPFTGESPLAVAYQHVREEPNAPSSARPELTAGVDALVLKALSKAPLDRFQTAAEMESALVGAVAGTSDRATPAVGGGSDPILPAADEPAVFPPSAMAGASLFAPAQTSLPATQQRPEPNPSKKRWATVGIGVLCLALLVGAILLTMRVTRSTSASRQVVMPQVEGLTLERAKRALTDIGLTLGAQTETESATVPRGSVAKQDPSQGTPIVLGRPVKLQISIGIISVSVPDLKGLTPQDAQTRLAKLNLALKTVPVMSTEAEKNQIVAQIPNSNTTAKPGTTITVQVGAGPEYAVVPKDLIGKSYQAAAAELSAVGLTAIQRPVDGIEPLGTVLRYSGARPGASVAVGTPLTLQVSNNQLFVVPNLANQTVDGAVVQLTALGWAGRTSADLLQIPVITSDLALVGLIASTPEYIDHPDLISIAPTQPQTPAAGKTVRKTTQISVLVYTGSSSAIVGATDASTSSTRADVTTQSPSTTASLSATTASTTTRSTVHTSTATTTPTNRSVPVPPITTIRTSHSTSSSTVVAPPTVPSTAPPPTTARTTTAPATTAPTTTAPPTTSRSATSTSAPPTTPTTPTTPPPPTTTTAAPAP